jgi:hypothetical protein
MDDGEWMIYGDFACHYQPLLTIINHYLGKWSMDEI